MELTGQVWFRFAPRPVWTFYRFVRSVAENGGTVALEWIPLPDDSEHVAMHAFLSLDDPVLRGRFLHAMLGLVHLEGKNPGDIVTVAAAAAAADVEIDAEPGDRSRLDEVGRVAADLGVTDVPSLYRLGTPLQIVLTPAAVMDDPTATLRTILDAAADDGIWELRKP